MDGIFSKNLNDIKLSDKKKTKKHIENFIKENRDSTFSDDYFLMYYQLKNPHCNFFSKTLLNEINYVNLKGSDFFGAFTNTEKKLEYFIKENNNYIKSASISFGIPLLRDKIIINKKAILANKKNIENEFEKYLNFYPEDNKSHFFLDENSVNEKSNHIITNNYSNEFQINDSKSKKNCKKNKFDNLILLEENLNLDLKENEKQTESFISK